MSAKPVISVERLTHFVGTDLEDLCDAADAAIVSGGGFGWVKPPPRHVFESFWKGVLVVPERQLFVGRLDGTMPMAANLGAGSGIERMRWMPISTRWTSRARSTTLRWTMPIWRWIPTKRSIRRSLLHRQNDNRNR